MLRFFKIFSEIAGLAMVACLLLIGATLLLEIEQISRLQTMESVTRHLHPLINPFLDMVRAKFGEHFFEAKTAFGPLTIDMAYNIFIVVLVVLFIFLYYISGLLHRMDAAAVEGWRNFSHSRFMKRKKKQLADSPAIQGKESSCIAALRFDHIQPYPNMVESLQQILTFSATVFSDRDRYLLKFQSTADALNFALAFRNEFKRIRKETRVAIGMDPEYRVALHSLEPLKSLGEDETFIWGMLTCMNPFQIYLSDTAKAQLDLQQKSTHFPVNFQVSQAGTFARLGNRTFPELYRLDVQETSFGQQGLS